MSVLRRKKINQIVELLQQHDDEEKRLIDYARQHGEIPDAEWVYHDKLERVILYTMAAAADAEIVEAIDIYDGRGREI